MSENPEDPPRESAGEDRTRRIDRPSPPGQSHPQPDPDQSHTQQGQGYPQFSPPPGQSYPQPGQGQSHTQQSQNYHQQGQGYPSPGQGQPPSGQGYGYPPPSVPPYDVSGHGYQSGYQGGHQAGYPQPGAYGYGYQAPPGTYGPRPGSDDTTLAMLAHLLGLLTWFVGPLVVYLAKKDEAPYVRDQAAEALNFQLTLMIAYAVSWILAFVLIGFILMFVVWIGSIIFMIIAAIAANRGENYRYPMNIRFVS
ncbi:DUF4870 domain-containing protein [Streptosporangium sp. 'caverna']|uniref:DUF4870 domain-containing protein n=1 Tax=Streptosporangium sp. 'caverna' TaxID=2202249 RepID=UPI000D7D81F8|nr:DUF4870 domain-containing protein [Streptosporangium sp. 'caverna']AWS41509.1 DUF4870 domain-containing protein [Streptosporangium sp. 'caverna']